MKIPRCKGARDLLPQDMSRFRRIEEVFRACCLAWGYGEIRTPTLEYLQLFTSAGTLSPSMLDRVYSFLDWDGWSGERVVLRPDGTIPSARLYVENLSKSRGRGSGGGGQGTDNCQLTTDNWPVARLCYIENMFSFEGSGQESRERWQCGVELIGGTEPEGDSELIMLALEILQKLDVRLVNVRLSHVGLLKALLQELGMEDKEQAQMLGEMLAGDTGALSRYASQESRVKSQESKGGGLQSEASPDSRLQTFIRLLGLQGKSPGFLANLKSVLPEKFCAIKTYIDDLAQVAELLDSIGQSYQIDFASGEGFEYYTGMVFRFYSSEELVGKGGRYDELIPLVGGDNVPASGFALFTDRLISLLGAIIGEEKSERILLTGRTGNIQEMKSSFEIASLLREKGCIVENDLGQRHGDDYRWIVSLEKDGEAILLTLTDKTTGREQKGLSVDQLLQRVESQESRVESRGGAGDSRPQTPDSRLQEEEAKCH
ncbi:MAG: Histidine--tRNA ligase [Dehalococcoidia bacterium]|nr:Histidine--tRNA ligase [Chloroflexota bacterium]